MAKQSTRQVSIFLNGKEVENSIKAIAAEQKKANNELSRMIRGTDEYVAKASEVRRLNAILADHKKGLNSVEQGWSLVQAGIDKFVGLAAGAFTVDAVIGFGKELFNTAVEMESMSKKARIVFGEALPEITKAAEANATQMGLTTAQYIAQAAAIQDILVPMGFQRKQAADISSQLVNLSGALSEWTGGQVSAKQVTEILSSALTGEREQLKQLGIVLSQADIDARVAEKGMSKLTGTLKQQAEAAASLELILEKSQDAQTAYANNSGDMARRSAELSARLQEVKERLADALVPVFEATVTVMEDAGDAFSSFVSALEDPKWGESLKRALSPFLGVGGGSLITRIFGTKKEVNEAQAQVDQLVAETNALLVKYGVNQAGKTPPSADPNAEEKKKREKQRLEREQERLRRLKEKEEEDERLFQLEQKNQQALKLLADARAKAQSNARRDFLNQEKETLDLNLENYDEAKDKQALIDKAYEEGRLATQQKIDEVTTSSLTDYVKTMEEHYRILIELAEQYGLDVEALEKDLAEKRKDTLEGIRGGNDPGSIGALNDEQKDKIKKLQDYFGAQIALAAGNAEKQADLQRQLNEELLSLDAEYNLKRLGVYQAAFQGIASSLEDAFYLFSDSESKFVAFQKALAIAQIAIDTATAISSIVAAAASTSITPIDLAIKIATGTALVLANIAKAKKLLDAPIPVKQKFMGGYHGVVGETDGRTYYPSIIGAPNTGLLPGNSPVMFRSNVTGAPILANERGREYFVSHRDLQNPAVANYVQMIDSIVNSGARVRQFSEGGSNVATSATPTAIQETPLMREIAANIALNNQLLTYLIQNGVMATVPDGTIIGINDRLKTLQKISGGYF